MELDYDLRECLNCNPQDAYTGEDIKEVLAVYEGARDSDAWRWVFQLNSGRFVFLLGWCSYTGWDCCSEAKSDFADTALEAAQFCLTETYFFLYDNREISYEGLVYQIREGKQKTWREQKDDEFGVKS